MSTVDEVLATAEVVDAVCVIDGETRIISVPNEYKELGVESDEKVTRIKFRCPKIVGDNADLTEYNLYINYRNAANKLNSYLVEDVAVADDTLSFSWLLSRHVTESPGTISYIVCAKKSDDTGVINEWNTKVATGIVGVGLEATQEIEEQNIDVIEQILKAIVDLENGSGGSGSSGGANPDWNQNDETAADYVKNRPFYTGNTEEVVLLEENSVEFTDAGGMYVGIIATSTFEPTLGETYNVYWDGTLYECVCKNIYSGQPPAIGNISIAGVGPDTGEPFLLAVDTGEGIRIATSDTSTSHTISISETVTPVVKIDKRYLHNPDWNQSDKTSADYVKNRPFYAIPPETVLLEESTLQFFDLGGVYTMVDYSNSLEIIPGVIYKVSWDGTEYECTCIGKNGGSCLGNMSIAGNSSDTGEPFVIITIDDEAGQVCQIGTKDTSPSHTISIHNVDEQIVKIDEKYLPAMTIPNKLIFTGAVSAEYDGSAAVSVEIPTVPSGPSALPNPNKLTFTGAVSTEYDGSAAVSVEIPGQFKPEGKSYLTFSSPHSFTLKVNDTTKHWDGTIEYFASDKTWTIWDGTTTLSSIDNDGEYVLYLRGTGNTVITGSGGPTYSWILTGTDISCVGNIENILDYEMVESGGYPTMAIGCYRSMFEGCTSLIEAPALPSTTLTDQCYRAMFRGCTSLTKAPVLPAVRLFVRCYAEMFSGCTALIQAPVLPAGVLASYCYSSMFSNCSRLTQAPTLPASALAQNCYSSMFYNCSRLIQAPVLPATKLESYCYSGMFEGCTSLIEAPALPATTLTDGCYEQMFKNCTSLIKAPVISATNVLSSSFRKMFYNCPHLTQVPALPAASLSYGCYREMFYNCTKIKFSSTQTEEYTQEYRIPTSGTGVTASDALKDMFVNTGGTFTGTPEINTTYYLSRDNMIVRDTELATLREYVKSMIDNAIANAIGTA